VGTSSRAAHRSLDIAPSPPPEPPAVDGALAQLGPTRHYRGSDRTVSMSNVTSVREAARAGVVPVPVTVMLDDALVSGRVGVSHHGGMRYQVGEIADQPLVCDRDMVGGCGHVDEAIESSRALLEARQIRTGLQGLGQATDTSAGVLAADHDMSVAAQQQAAAAAAVGGGSSWAEDPAGFQAAYNAALGRRSRGEPAVPFMTEDATGGLGARDGGRGFGVEMEFDIDPSVNRHAALQAIADDLHREGLLRSPRQASYHSSADYSRWRFEHDSTVDGEIISPIMYDEPQSWAQLAKVCEVVRRHGGRATARTGGHVHVSVADYDHTVDNHRRLLAAYREHEDELFRVAQNPERSRHRGTSWCRPNPDLEVNFGPARDVVTFVRGHSSHGYAMNFGGAASGSSSSHVEYRMWDSSLDPGTIQTQVKLSLGMTQAAFASPQPAGAPMPVGTHRAANAGLGRGRRLRGEAWHSDTRSFRGLVDRVFRRDADKAQAAALFAVTKWQRA
jgi:hypothetical protein